MMIDAPGYDDEAANDEIVLTEDNAEGVLKYVNNLF